MMVRKRWKQIWLAVVSLSSLAATAKADVVTYYYTSQQGTVLATADAAGNVISNTDYRPYGTSALGSPDNGPGYAGHVNDSDSALVYMQARYYDPSIGRFLSVDLLGAEIDPGLVVDAYVYVDDNPLTNWDPSGLCAVDADGGDCPSDPAPSPQKDVDPSKSGSQPKQITTLPEIKVQGQVSTAPIGIPPPIFKPPAGKNIFRPSIVKPVVRKIDDYASNKIIKTLSFKALKITKTGVLRVTPIGAGIEALTHVDSLGGCDDNGHCADEAPASSLRNPPAADP